MPPHGEIQPLRAFILPALVLLYAQQREPAARVSALQPAVGLCAGPRRSGTHTCVKVHDQHKPAATRCSHVLGGRCVRAGRGGGGGSGGGAWEPWPSHPVMAKEKVTTKKVQYWAQESPEQTWGQIRLSEFTT